MYVLVSSGIHAVLSNPVYLAPVTHNRDDGLRQPANRPADPPPPPSSSPPRAPSLAASYFRPQIIPYCAPLHGLRNRPLGVMFLSHSYPRCKKKTRRNKNCTAVLIKKKKRGVTRDTDRPVPVTAPSQNQPFWLKDNPCRPTSPRCALARRRFLCPSSSSPLAPFSPLKMKNTSPACDVWALGVTLYQMVYGTLPFWPPSGNHSELEIMVAHRELSFPPTSGVSSFAGGGGAGGGAGASVGAGAGAVGSSAAADEKGWKGVRTLSSGGLTTLEAYDPMAGYLRVSLGSGAFVWRWRGCFWSSPRRGTFVAIGRAILWAAACGR